MLARFIDRTILVSILTGTHTYLHLRELVRWCYDLALPVVRKKIVLGKLNLAAIGLKESDVVYDCLADLFQRDDQASFPQIRTFLEHHLPNFESCSDQEILVAFRTLVVGKVNENIIRVYGETDPMLRKILRNLKLALERSNCFEGISRFNEMYFVPAGVDPLFHLPPITVDFLKQEFTRTVVQDDLIPGMLNKLYETLCNQEEYQRAVGVVDVAVLFKDIYAFRWQTEQQTEIIQDEPQTTHSDLLGLVNIVCRDIRTEMLNNYVRTGKCTQQEFESYVQALQKILQEEFGGAEKTSYFNCLQDYLPGLTKESYTLQHRNIMEYLAKIAKERLREEFSK
jgi:hypothetical protein